MKRVRDGLAATSGPGRPPVDLAGTTRSIAPIVLLVLAALAPAARPIVLLGLVVGTAVTIGRGAPSRWAWAAPVPVAVSLCWGLLPAPPADPLGGDCTAFVSPPAFWRASEAAVTLASLGALALLLRARRADLGLRWPARPVVVAGVAGAIALGPIGLLSGASLARPFFGTFELDLSRPEFLLPALLFAVANGTMEELAYRGALLGWSARVTGPGIAAIGQAVVFGVAHGGADVAGLPVVLMLTLGVGGWLAGVVALRTRSLLVPIAWHVALDLPLYVYLACRA